MKKLRVFCGIIMIALLTLTATAQGAELSLQKIIDNFVAYNNVETATASIETATATFSENGFAISANPEEKIKFSFVPKESFVPKRASCYVMNISATINSNKYFIVSREKGGQTFFGGLLKVSPDLKLSCVIYNPGEDIPMGGKISYEAPYILIWHQDGVPPSIFNTIIRGFLPRHDVKPVTKPVLSLPPSKLDVMMKVIPLYLQYYF